MEYELIRSRRRSLAIEISYEKGMIVRAPLRMKQAQIDAFLKKKEGWIEKQLMRFSSMNDCITEAEPISAEKLEELKKEARAFFPGRVRYFADRLSVTYGRISIKCQSSLWGSCSAKGNLNFNCLLMLMSEDIRDYIIVHELCHRKHMNHSAAFWRAVESIIPDYRALQRRIEREGRPLLISARRTRNAGAYYTYILRCCDNSLYTGYTTDLENRLRAHNSGKGARYTRVRRPVTLVYYEVFPSKQEAMRREALIKQLSKREKEKLIGSRKE